MSQRIGVGGTITLEATYADGTGTLVTPGTPRVDILDPNGVELVTNAVPTQVGTGQFEYPYTVPGAGPTGSWTAHWTGTINGVAVEDDEQFDVVAAGEISFGGEDDLTCEPWATEADICSPCDDYTFPVDLLDRSLRQATDILFALSGRQFPGICTATVRPCAGCGEDRIPSGWYPDWSGRCACISNGQISNCSGCGCSASEIALSQYPVVTITNVKVDGVVLDSSRYRLDDRRTLIRKPDADGSNPGWPTCQRLDLDDDQPDTWSITFTYGRNPPYMGVVAAASLACQLALACSPETIDQCRLPRRVTQITRQGVTAVVLDNLEVIREGFTAISEVDLFLKAVNPHGLIRRGGVWSPDAPRIRVPGA